MATPTTYVQVCTAFDEGGVCTATSWVPYTSSGWAPLSIESAQAIGVSIALLWAAAWVIKMCKRMLESL